jgi:succinate dehydrogenase/fumarate reductase flavoprotein subunit
MAYYERLPIYKKAMEVAVYFENIVKNFSRYNKYTLGSELRTVSRDIVKLIIKANSAREKLPILHELRERLEELKVLIRNGDEITFPSRRIDLGQICSISNHKS